jgi:predicted transcriptional regulator
MATHSDIVKRAGKPEEVALACAVSPHTVRSWIQRDSIPAEKWAWFANEDHASLEELAEYAAARKPSPTPHPASNERKAAAA